MNTNVASGPSCVITGASGGIGSALARILDSQGRRLILAGRDRGRLRQLQEDLILEHGILVADLASVEGRQQLFDCVINNPEIHHIVQAAGASSFALLEDQNDNDIERLLHLNLVVPVLVSQAVLPILKSRRDAILLNVGSALGSIGFAGYSTYCASKFGLRGFTEALQRELDGSGVSIKYFAPRATSTAFNPEAVQRLNQVLGNRTDSPELVAEQLLSMLTNKRNRHVVGWPEKFFCRLNGLWPELVDRVLATRQTTIIDHAHMQVKQSMEGISS